jgi:branched-chain amino acid transport system permease protein
MVAVSEIFRSGGFGLLDSFAKTVNYNVVTIMTGYIKQAHVLSFGVLVILVILFLPNGIVGDWRKLKRGELFRR